MATNVGRLWTLYLLAGLVCTSGCGGSAAVLSGSVTYDGKPVENGWIAFVPVDGLGPISGGPIADGKYRVDFLKAGAKTVQIVGVKKVNFAQPSEEMARAANAGTKTTDATGIIDRADTIPADAEGNNLEVIVAAGTHEMDFQLKRPAAAAKQ